MKKTCKWKSGIMVPNILYINIMLVPVIGHLVIAAVNQEIEIEIIDGKGVKSIGGLTRIGVRD